MQTAMPIFIPPTLRCTEEQFRELVKFNPDLRWELTAQGEVIVMAPTGSETGNYNFELNTDLGTWNRQQKMGKAFDSSAGFRLPNGAIRSPDLAWIAQERWEQLSPEQRRQFAPICPDFVLELVSPADDLATVQAKMQEYLKNGCRLGWLVNPETRSVTIYRPNVAPEIVTFDVVLSGEDVLPGFTVDLRHIFGSDEL
ncbi:Uma2 family endonuclease [Synechococcus sp. C9]|uniref:Uma2 family endonuclease n=1 Tax=Synechococcus sp. C9 TaxID=102119 RepID=UPI001FF48F5F|nr:Uma2 family endonuclease [Synechococcus sp. C9]